MALLRQDGDMRVTGHFSAGTMTVPSASISNSQVASNAAVVVTKLQHLYKADTDFGLDSDATPVAHTRTVFTAKGAGTIRNFNCLLNDTGTSTDVDFDLLINGVSALSSAVKVTHADSDRQTKTGTLSTTALVAGDVVTIDLAVTSSTGAQGPYAWAEIDEAAN